MRTLFSYFCKAKDSPSTPASTIISSVDDARNAELPVVPTERAHDQTAPPPRYSAATMNLQTKIEVVLYAEEHSVPAASRQYNGLSRATIGRWVAAVKHAREQALSKCPPGAAPMPIDYKHVLLDGRRSNGRHLPAHALEAAFDRFQEAREAGVPVSTGMLRQMVISAVNAVDPTIVYSMSNLGGWFKCSDLWLREWKRANLISRRRTTTARRTQIGDLEEVRTRFLHRVAYVVHEHGIPPGLVFHADETGVNLSPAPNTTLDFQGSASVAVLGSGDKRQATVMLGGTLDGSVLRPQIIFEGKTTRVLPKVDEPEVELTHTPNHWASFDTTTQWLATVLLPHAARQKAHLGLAPDHPCLLLWDVWHQHKSPEMIAHIAQHYPWLRLVFVPANTTDYLQIADVAMNMPFKTHIRQRFAQLMLERHEDPDNEPLSTMDLRTHFIAWAVEAAHHVRSIDAVCHAARSIGLDQCFTDQMAMEAQLAHQLGDLWVSVSRNDAVAVQGSVTRCVTENEPEEATISVPVIAMSDAGTVVEAAGHKRRRCKQMTVRCGFCKQRGHNQRSCPKRAEHRAGILAAASAATSPNSC